MRTCTPQPFFGRASHICGTLINKLACSLGGGIRLAGDIGRFGIISTVTGREDLLHFICNRGDAREVFWTEFATRFDLISKGKAKAVKTKVDPMLGYSLPLEPEGVAIDPNHGPGSHFWRKLLEVVSDDDYSMSTNVTLLVASMLNRVDDVASFLIEKRVSINTHDGAGITPLMYALLFRNDDQFQALLTHGADADSVSANGDPVIKFVFTVAELLDWDSPVDLNGPRSINWNISYVDALHNSDYVHRVVRTLVDRNVDLCVSDSDGNGPLHYALGFINSKLSLGGKLYALSGYVYPEESDTLCPLLAVLCRAGADPNACNTDGVRPLHIAASITDVEGMEFLLSVDANPNPLDCHLYHPLHYLCGAGRNKSMTAFHILLTKGSFRPLEGMDQRVNRAKSILKSERNTLELQHYIRDSFSEAICPQILTKKRLTPIDLAGLRTRENLNLIHLSLSGHFLSYEPFAKYAEKNKRIRLRLVDGIHKIDGFTPSEFYSCVDNFGLSMHHASAVLFHEPMDTYFYPNRPKVKGKKPLSMEHEIISHSLLQHPSALHSLCSYEIELLSPEIRIWAPLHAAIAIRNSELVRFILQQNFNLTSGDYIHLAIKSHLSPDIMEDLLKHIIYQTDYKYALNGCSLGFRCSPLHLAVRCQNVAFVRLACKYAEFDFNVRDEFSGLTPFFEACLMENIAIVNAFLEAIDRIDLYFVNNEGRTCFEVAIDHSRLETVIWILRCKKVDCIEILTRNSSEAPLLYALERDHFELLKATKKMAIVGEVHTQVQVHDALDSNADGFSSDTFPLSKLVECNQILLPILMVVHSTENLGFDHYHPIYSPEAFDPSIFSV